MGLRYSSLEDKTCLYDSVTEWAFGPVFNTGDAADRFLDWAQDVADVKDGDVRALTTPEMVELWDRYRRETENPYG